MEKIKEKNLIVRPSVVVVLGHVDHGKSSLLESIKDFKITSKESGGITQHIGAYEIEHEGKRITFIDTPGHEAFSAMRARGSKAADIAILTIASDEGVKPQTKEAIDHIKKAGIPMVVAINKIDKPNSNPEKVKGELAKNDVLVESMGGKIPSVEVSAVTKKGIPDLIEMILLLSEMENLVANLSKKAKGVVVEAHIEPRRGLVSTLIVQEGTLKKGDIIVSPSSSGKVKILENFQGKPIKEAIPSMPIIVIGFDTLPKVGEEFKACNFLGEINFEKVEKEISKPLSIEEGKKTLNLIIKTDFVGSLEAVQDVLKQIPQDRVAIKILKAEVGEIDESDIKLANSFNAKILGFRVKTNNLAIGLASREKVRILNFKIIYELIEAVRNFLEKLLEPEIVKKDIGNLKILEVFKVDKGSIVLGGRVISGEIKKGAFVNIYRNEEKIGKGKISGLQKNKKNAGEAIKGEECGILYSGDVSAERGDIFKAYIEERKKGEL